MAINPAAIAPSRFPLLRPGVAIAGGGASDGTAPAPAAAAAPASTAIQTSGIQALFDAIGRWFQGIIAWFTSPSTSTPAPASAPAPTPTTAPPPPVPTGTPAAPIPAVGGFLRGVNLSGAEFGAQNVPGTYGKDYTYPTPQELDYFKSKGMQVIRLPFLWERMQPQLGGPLDPVELARMDTFVAECRQRGLQVILDAHDYGRYKGQLIGSAAVPDSAFQDFWAKLAQHYANEPAIYAYDLCNEPHDTGGLWAAAAQSGDDGVRQYDRNHLVMVEGDGWAGAWTWAENNPNLNVQDPTGKLMYEAHQYFDKDGSGTYQQSYDASGAYPTIGVDRLKPFVQWLQQRHAQGFIGEYGVPDNDPRWNTVLDDTLTYMDQQHLGGTYWAGGPWWGNYALGVDPRNGQDRPQMAVLQKHPGQ